MPRYTSNKRSSSSKVRNSNRGSQHNSAVVTVLKAIDQKQMSQTHGTEPNVPDVPRLYLKRNKVYTFERCQSIGAISYTTSDVSNAYSFTLGALPGSGEFTALFDSYRLIQVTLDFIPTGSTAAVPTPLYSVLDYDDAVGPTALNDLLQYDTLKVTSGGAFHSRTFTPRYATAAYSGVFTSFSQSKFNDWVDVASPSVLYFGCKIWMPSTTAMGVAYAVTARVVLQCQNTR